MSTRLEFAPIAQLDFVADGNLRPGWYVRYQVHGRPASERLPIEIGADAFGAMSEAAEFLGCSVDQIEFGGPIWPKPLDGMVDADETLEYIANSTPELVPDDGTWRLQEHQGADPEPKTRVEARQSARRVTKDVLLYGPVYGRVLNWSESGMGIEIGQPLRLESRELFQAKGKRSMLELYGEVCWCRKIHRGDHGESPSYHAGVNLIG